MKRELFGANISQQSKTGFFSANDLMTAGNKFRAINELRLFKLQDWLNLPSTKEFIIELEIVTNTKVKIATRGRTATTWIHPFLFIDLALYISPKLKIEVYQWITDELLKYRNDSGDSYKKMAGALYLNTKNKSKFPIIMKKAAQKIQNACKVTNWQEATTTQLKMRNKIHENIALLCDVLKSNKQAIKLGIMKTTKI